ncbi:MAG: DUF6323 family protein [Clostridium sp.]
MNKFIMKASNGLIENGVLEDIITCNKKTIEYGLKLNESEAKTLMSTRKEALVNNGRIEFSGEVIRKIIEVFCDSPYISQYNYVDTIDELIDIFYFYKNETLDFVGDDEMIEMMKNFFDGSCQGSLELLQNREMYKVERNIKNGIHDYLNIGEDKDDMLIED